MRQQPGNTVMAKAFTLLVLTTMVGSCIPRARAWKEPVQWPNDYSDKNVVPFMEAGAALAAAAAVREMVRTNPFPRLFEGCSSPEQGLDVAVYRGPTAGLFYVLVDQRFDRCGGPRVRVLDGWYEYAVTPQGEVIAESPASAGEETSLPPDAHPPAPSDVGPPPPTPPNPPAPSVDAGTVTSASAAEDSTL
ncbi:hypothetical protein [Hyalangium minutum]|uniref:Lipoprotein n=1 Tax=Hyalangium minutum TaxID=394096 RepID=A0A085WS47_9BACT|nr:hypothetical protein [Hyalangium minutum]KFE70510.1 hypothetical protein DB31_5552 [Hyalangium minutum]